MADGVFNNYFFEKNMQGDITAIFKGNGAKIGTYCYDAWGNVKTTVSSGITALEKNILTTYNSFRYRGYYYDTESGLYYLQSRYYNPEWGRFLNADGYISTGTGLIGYNMYAYCNNNPVIYVDPCGKCIHNGVAQGMGLDCPDCRAGITRRDDDQVRTSFTYNDSFNSEQYYLSSEQYYMDMMNGRAVESDDKFSDVQNITNYTLSSFTTVLGLVSDSSSAVGVTGIGYMITTPAAITFHSINPKLDTGEKFVMVGYELGVATGGIILTVGLVNWWNPAGWIMIAAPIAYTVTTSLIGSTLQSGLENN